MTARGFDTGALNDPHDPKPLGTDITRLVKGYGMVDKPQPVFSDSKSRNARYYISNNFLKAWLAVAKLAREAARLKPMEKDARSGATQTRNAGGLRAPD